MPLRIGPTSCTARRAACERRPEVLGQLGDPRLDRRRCPTRAGGRPPRRGRGGRRRSLPLLEPAGVGLQLVAERPGPGGGPQVDERRVEPLDDARADVEEARAARARAGTCGRWRRAGRSRSRPRRPAAGRPTGRRRAGRARRPPGSGGRSPPTGVTEPFDVGTWVTATSPTPPRSSSASSAARSTCPARRRAGAPPRRRCAPRPGHRHGVARVLGARGQDPVARRRAAPRRRPCPRPGSRSRRTAISLGCAPIRRAIERRCRRSAPPTACGGLVPAHRRLAVDLPRAPRRAPAAASAPRRRCSGAARARTPA